MVPEGLSRHRRQQHQGRPDHRGGKPRQRRVEKQAGQQHPKHRAVLQAQGTQDHQNKGIEIPHVEAGHRHHVGDSRIGKGVLHIGVDGLVPEEDAPDQAALVRGKGRVTGGRQGHAQAVQ